VTLDNEWKPKTPEEERVVEALALIDGDAARPEHGVTPLRIAQLVLRAHWDLAQCFCPACVLAGEVIAWGPVRT